MDLLYDVSICIPSRPSGTKWANDSLGKEKGLIKVAALTGGYNIPSTRFRLRQYITPLYEHDIKVIEYCPFNSLQVRLPGPLSKIRRRYMPPVVAAELVLNTFARMPGVWGTYKADLTWIERKFLPGFETLCRTTRSPRVLDVDDAVWMSYLMGEKSVIALTKNVDAVIAGNKYLAEWFSKYCKEVYVIPTAIDCERYKPKDRECSTHHQKQFVIGWTGTSVNFRYLKLIEKSLARFMKDYPDAKLLVIADEKPTLRLIPEENISFAPWNPEIEASILSQMDVGVMPLSDDNWTRGKCSFKMLQYMAATVPVIVSPVGMNNDILKMGFIGYSANSDSEWYEALESMYSNHKMRRQMGLNGRAVVEKKYSRPIISAQIADVIKNMI